MATGLTFRFSTEEIHEFTVDILEALGADSDTLQTGIYQAKIMFALAAIVSSAPTEEDYKAMVSNTMNALPQLFEQLRKNPIFQGEHLQ